MVVGLCRLYNVYSKKGRSIRIRKSEAKARRMEKKKSPNYMTAGSDEVTSMNDLQVDKGFEGRQVFKYLRSISGHNTSV